MSSSLNQGEGFDNDVEQQHSGFDSSSNAQSSASSGANSGSGGFGQHQADYSGQQQSQSGFGSGSGAGFARSGHNQVGGQQQSGFAGSTANAKGLASSGSNGGFGDSSNQHNVEHFDGNDQQRLQSGFGSGANAGAASNSQYGSSDQGFAERGDQGQYQQQQVSQGFGSNAGSSGYSGQHGHEALNGALNLAHQGLQTGQQAGCSTCGKSSYALSNAKSDSGSAVAVSVGG